MVAEQTRKCGRQGFFLVSELARIFVMNFMLVTFLGCCGCLLDFFRLPCGNQLFYKSSYIFICEWELTMVEFKGKTGNTGYMIPCS